LVLQFIFFAFFSIGVEVLVLKMVGCYMFGIVGNVVLQAVNAPDGIHTNIQNGVYTSRSSVDANTTETILNQPKADLQRSGNSQTGIKPTLDRINL